jgi:hypothetical protein
MFRLDHFIIKEKGEIVYTKQANLRSEIGGCYQCKNSVFSVKF